VSRPELLVDGRVLGDAYPGVRRFWLPVLRAWAARGGRGMVAHRRAVAPEPALLEADFAPLELARDVRDPRAMPSARRAVRASGVSATLSPLYLTLDGAPRNLASVFDVTGRSHPRSATARWLWELVMWRTLRGASSVLTASRAAACQLEAALPGLRGRVELVSPVAPPAARANPRLVAPFELVSPFALVVASHRPHKRLEALTRVWSQTASAPALVLVGHGSHRLNALPGVRGLGFVGDELLEALLAAAGCLLSASLSEGFGLPLLAALASGTPVVASRLPALEELGGTAVSWCEPEDLVGLVARAGEVVANPSSAREQCLEGRARAQHFGAERASQALARLLA
jgi:glycosyltransferase involved in cell wall biosynthesis